MARGVYLIGSKLARRVRAVQIMDCAGNSATLRLRDYLSRKIQPEYEVLPWHGLADVFFKTDSGLLAARLTQQSSNSFDRMPTVAVCAVQYSPRSAASFV